MKFLDGYKTKIGGAVQMMTGAAAVLGGLAGFITEVLAAQAAKPVVGGAGVAEIAHQVGERVAVLPHREPGEFHARGAVVVACRRRVEGGMDEFGDAAGIFSGDPRGIVLGHRLVDVRGQLAAGPIAHQRMRHGCRARPIHAVAADAVFPVDRGPGVSARWVGANAGAEHERQRRGQRAGEPAPAVPAAILGGERGSAC